VSELGILGVRHVEVVLDDELVEDVLGHLAMDRQVVLAAGELGDGATAGHDGKAGHATDRERLDVVRAEHQDHVRLALVERLAELLDRGLRLIELLRILVRWPREQVRRVARAECCNDLAHEVLLELTD
jgi:hypothetical protein